ncbi:hypothetical protein WEI85_05890 [Actinomycetes bacterium KLBMP 9797]
MATVYRSETVRLAAAQQVLDEHTTLTATGRCRTCCIPGPCPWWEAATAAFAQTGQLPRRTPGRTHPELVGARRLAVPGVPREEHLHGQIVS